MTISLHEHDILQHFLPGLHTPLGEGRRSCLTQFGTIWLAHLGNCSVELSTEQAIDLCTCIDVVGEEYLQTLSQTSTLLDLWGYSEVKVHAHQKGVCILAIAGWLWSLLCDFADAFSSQSGTSPWHIFEGRSDGSIQIIITPPFPSVTLSPISDEASVPAGYVGIAYPYPDLYLEMFEHHSPVENPDSQRLWTENIGPTGFWTASYTETWLTETCLPHVLAHFGISSQRSFLWRLSPWASTKKRRQPSTPVPWQSRRGSWYTPLAEVKTVEQLLLYLEDLQRWFNGCPVDSIATELVGPYYQALVEILHQHTVVIAPDDRYAWSEVMCAFPREEEENRQARWQQGTYDQLLQALDEHVARVHSHSFETKWQADRLSRAFLWLFRQLEYAGCSADALQHAARMLAPLWEVQHFSRSCFDE